MRHPTINVSFALDPKFIEQENFLVELAYAMANGDESRADEVRDKIEATSQQLPADQIMRLNSISGDLYMIDGSEVLEPLKISETEFLKFFLEGFHPDRVQAFLALLRTNQSLYDREAVAGMRSRLYVSLNHYSVALAFADIAIAANTKEPENYYSKAEILGRAGMIDEAVRLINDTLIWANDNKFTNAFAASVLYVLAEHMNARNATSLIAQAKSLLEDGLTNIENSSWNNPYRFGRLSNAYYLLGVIYAREQDKKNAIDAFSKSISANPTNADAYVQRAIIINDLDSQSAKADIQSAVKYGTSFSPTYIIASRYALIEGDFTTAYELAVQAINDPDALIKAHALELAGIALSQQHHGLRRAVQMLQLAVELLPNETRMQDNLAVITAAASSNRKKQGSKKSSNSWIYDLEYPTANSTSANSNDLFNSTLDTAYFAIPKVAANATALRATYA